MKTFRILAIVALVLTIVIGICACNDTESNENITTEEVEGVVFRLSSSTYARGYKGGITKRVYHACVETADGTVLDEIPVNKETYLTLREGDGVTVQISSKDWGAPSPYVTYSIVPEEGDQ